MTREDIERAATELELVLITPGRRSGQDREVKLWFAYEDGAVWLRTDRAANWYRNLESARRCRLRLGALEVEGELDPFEDEEAALRHLIELWRAKYGVDYVADWYVDRGRVPVRIRLLP